MPRAIIFLWIATIIVAAMLAVTIYTQFIAKPGDPSLMETLSMEEPAPPKGLLLEDGSIEIHVTKREDYDLGLREVGIDPEVLRSARVEWWRATGHPPGRYNYAPSELDHPYSQYDEQKLATLAAAGDVWAIYYLAEFIRTERPREAYENFREAALHGSIYAMTEIAGMYYALAMTVGRKGRMTRPLDNTTRDQIRELVSGREPLMVRSAAWNAAAGILSPPNVERRPHLGLGAGDLSDEDIEPACEEARRIVDELNTERAGRGLPPLEIPPRPTFDQFYRDQANQYCEPVPPPMNVTGCRQVRTVYVGHGGGYSLEWVCAGVS